ncbi:septation protein SepH [Nocardioides marinquilinus]|uniref:Septation protein SepH n=1 Tax=Nocardioides marinquilinus TaxID=1210400 RepID=A0ABP9PPN6_9ACTN
MAEQARDAVTSHLSLAGVSDDRRRLLLVDDRGTQYTLDITPGLRAALRGDATRLGQLEITMDSALRPRDIQARIRSGESPDDVARAAQTTVEAIMPFVGPVLAERQHIADRAQRSTLRRPAGESGGSGAAGRTLGDAVSAHLRALDVDPDTVEWDAWRREDGRWVLAADFTAPGRSGSGRFTFDPPGNYVVLDDDDARWLVGEAVASPGPSRDDLRSVRERRLAAVPPDELPLGDDAIEMVSAEPDGADGAEEADGHEEAVEAFLDDSPASDDVALRDEAADAAAAEPEPQLDLQTASEADAEPPAPEPEEPPRRKKKGRSSVPSWDEIMFGPGDR